jgi:hypothetical protein
MRFLTGQSTADSRAGLLGRAVGERLRLLARKLPLARGRGRP